MTALCRLPVGAGGGGASFGTVDVGQRQAGGADAESADAEETTAGDAVTEAICLTEDGEHGGCSPFAEGTSGPQRIANRRREGHIGGYATGTGITCHCVIP